MEFLFKSLTWYLVNDSSKRVKFWVEYKIVFEGHRVISVLGLLLNVFTLSK